MRNHKKKKKKKKKKEEASIPMVADSFNNLDVT
jgi:hypothetical protein